MLLEFIIFIILFLLYIRYKTSHDYNLITELSDKQMEKCDEVVPKDFTKVSFIRIPKNASTSIYKHLGEKNTITDEKLIELGKNEKYHNILAPSHCKLSEALEYIGPDILKYPIFCICRNPYDRMVSAYTYSQISPLFDLQIKSFEEFIDKCIEVYGIEKYELFWMPQSNYINIKCNINILRYENLDKDFKNFILDNNLDISTDLPWLNQSNSSNYKSYYTEELRKKVYKIWKKDFNTFNYSKDL